MTLTRERQRVVPPVTSAPGTRARTRIDGRGHITAERILRDPNGGPATTIPLTDRNERYPVDLGDCAHPASIRIGGGITKNMGNFESIRLDVSIEWPFPPTLPALEQTHAWLTEVVDQKVAYELSVATGEINPAAEFGER